MFAKYSPLFSELIDSGAAGVCRWIESGSTIETALPDLGNLIDDKEEWRAVIVRYVDGDAMSACESDAKNPYDFLLNRGTELDVFENRVPLVRLTQMLGGVPPVEVQFRPEIVRERDKTARTIYVPEYDREKQKKHELLSARYRLKGKAPASILLITARKECDPEKTDIGSVWTEHRESDSSEFWKRNHYPSMCRFALVDFADEGSVRFDADEFGFWTSVLLMSGNDLDPGVMQAYKIYKLQPRFDKEKMTAAFQSMANRLRDARTVIEHGILRDLSDNNVEETLPKYRMDISVPVSIPEMSDYTVSRRAYHLTSQTAGSEIALWDRKRQEAESKLANAVRSARRTLDQTAFRMRGSYTFTEDEASLLGKYQEEDLKRETDEIYRSIVRIQGDLPTQEISDSEGADAASDEVRRYLRGRVQSRAAAVTLTLTALLLAFYGLFPAVWDTYKYREYAENFYYAELAVLIAAVAVVALGALVVLLHQKRELKKLIERYNWFLKRDFHRLIYSADVYSSYLSRIISHSRGISYLGHSQRMKNRNEDIHAMKFRHSKAINTMLGRIRRWSVAYHLNVDMTSRRTERRMHIDYAVAPDANKLYSFDTGKLYSTEINHSGMQLQSPLDFVRRLEIEREEFYDNSQ